MLNETFSVIFKHRAIDDIFLPIYNFFQIPGVPHLRLYKNTGEQIEMMNKVYEEYPTVILQIRNFIAEQTYDESIDHPCLKYYRKYFHFNFPFHTIRKVKFLSKIQFWQNPNIFTSFSPKFFWQFFSWNQSCQQS